MIIYKTTNTINNKSYIGQDKNNDKYYFGSGIYINRAIKKYGRKNFIKEILEDNIDTIDLLNEREIYWIKKLNTKCPNGYNLTDGGYGTSGFPAWNKGLTKETNRILLENGIKLSKIKTGITWEQRFGKESADIKKKERSEKYKGKNGPNYGNGEKYIGDKNPAKNINVRKVLSEQKLGNKNPNWKNVPDILFRNCPSCNQILYYSNKYNRKQADIKNRVCVKCSKLKY